MNRVCISIWRDQFLRAPSEHPESPHLRILTGFQSQYNKFRSMKVFDLVVQQE